MNSSFITIHPELEQVYQSISKILFDNLPEKWYMAWVNVVVEEGAGEMRCFFKKESLDAKVSIKMPVELFKKFWEIRSLMKKIEKKNPWTMAQFVLYNDGKFDLKFDYESVEMPNDP